MWKRRVKSMLTITSITIVMMVLVGECGLRLTGFEAPPLYRSDARSGWTLRPGVTTRYEDEGNALVTTSSAGLRDVEHAIEKPAGTYRIAVLGDSFAEALQIDRDQTFWARLEGELGACPQRRGRKIEVINFGVSSYGTANELLVLEDRVGPYSPDLVLTAFFAGNDVQDNHPKLDHLTNAIRPYYRPAGDGLELQLGQPPGVGRRAWASALGVSRVVQLVERVRKRRAATAANAARGNANHEAGVARELFGPPTSPEWVDAWNVTERLLKRMSEETRERHARFLLVGIAASTAIHPDGRVRDEVAKAAETSDLFYVDHRVGEIAQRAGIDYIALGPPMLEEATRTKKCLHGFANAMPCAGHWNEEGHRVASALVAQKICALWGTEQEARIP